MTIGDYCFRHSYWDNAHPYFGTEEGFGHRLVQQGFPVTTIGKLHYKGNMPETGFPDQRIPLNVKNGTGDLTHTIRDGSIRRPFLADEVRKAGPGDSEYLRYDAKVSELAVSFLAHEAKNTEKPWFLFVGFVCPHFPLRAPQEILDLYTPYTKLPFPKGWSKDVRPMHAALEFIRREFCTSDLNDDIVRKAVATYYGMVTYLDRQIGIVLDALDAAGLRENTRIIYTDDHGDTMGDHGLFFKHSMYEGSVGVPMILAGPDIPSGKVVKDEVSLLDIFPTVLDCMGAESKLEDSRLPGISLLEWAKADKPAMHRPIFSEYHNVGSDHASFMLRQGDYKLIYYVTYEPQLFNLKKDPDELHDLAHDPAYASILKKLEGLLREICDPEKVDAQAKREQTEMMNQYGGKEVVLRENPVSYSPVPAGVV
jgi:choline-sulfatase